MKDWHWLLKKKLRDAEKETDNENLNMKANDKETEETEVNEEDEEDEENDGNENET